MKFSSACPAMLDLCQQTLRSKNRQCPDMCTTWQHCSSTTHSHTLMTVRLSPILVMLVTWQSKHHNKI